MLVSMVMPFEPLVAVWLSWSIMVSLVWTVALMGAKAGMVAVAVALSLHHWMVVRIMLRRLVSRFCIFYLVIMRFGDWGCGEGREIFGSVDGIFNSGDIIFSVVIIIFSSVNFYFDIVIYIFIEVDYDFNSVIYYFVYVNISFNTVIIIFYIVVINYIYVNYIIVSVNVKFVSVIFVFMIVC